MPLLASAMAHLVHLLGLVASCAALTVSGVGFIETMKEELFPSPERKIEVALVSADARAASPHADDLPPFGPIFGKTQNTSISGNADAQTAPPFAYTLAGTFASEGAQWAILSGPSGNLVVGQGDSVGTTARIARIFADRIEVEHGKNSMILRFRDDALAGPVRSPRERSATTALSQARSPEAAAPYARMVRSVTMSREDVLALVAEAETRRAETVSR